MSQEMALEPDHEQSAAKQPVDPFARGSDDQLNLLAAVMVTDSRPSLVLSAEGELLLANAAAGALLVSEWSQAGSLPDWPELVANARSAGMSRIKLRDGTAGDLCHIVAGQKPGEEFFVLRSTHSKEQAALAQKAEEQAHMSHDLRVALQAVVAAAERLATRQDGVDAAEAQQAGQVARVALDRINDLLELSRMDRISPEAEPVVIFDLRALVADMAVMLASVGESSASRLELVLPDEPAWQCGPAHLVRAIIQNLVSNAFQSTTGGTVWLKLMLPPAASDAVRPITLEIADTGPGMPEAQIARLQGGAAAAPSSGSGNGGFGLGLGIASRAITRLGGKAEVQPREGGGTVVRIRFQMQTASPNGSSPTYAPLRLDGLRILVVEDNPVNLAILLRTLADAGADAEGVTSGADALSRIRQATSPADLMLLDVTMPGMDGMEVVRRVRAEEAEGRHLLVVGLTAHVDPAVQASCLAAGMDQVLTKPVGLSELRRAIREIWNGVVNTAQSRSSRKVGDKMLNDEVAAELVDEMGRQAAVSFMQQALAEARQVLQDLQAHGMTTELRSQVHSAIGSSGLTGLAGIERALRLLQSEARANVPLGEATEIFIGSIEKTTEALEALARA